MLCMAVVIRPWSRGVWFDVEYTAGTDRFSLSEIVPIPLYSVPQWHSYRIRGCSARPYRLRTPQLLFPFGLLTRSSPRTHPQTLSHKACATSRRQRAACRALCNAFRSRRKALLGSAMERLSAGPSTAAAAAAARAKAGAARRRRERESLGAAWRWWVSGWLRRQAQGVRCEFRFCNQAKL